jgi:glycine cleavage system H protein
MSAQTMFFTREHEWVRLEGGQAVFGISDHAQQQLGDITFIDLPEVGRKVHQFEKYAEVESVKAASEIYAPLAGEVIAVNEALAGDPGIINRSPESEGWLVRVRVADPTETGKLMDGAEYQEYLRETS